jgi:hypothetical protein
MQLNKYWHTNSDDVMKAFETRPTIFTCSKARASTADGAILTDNKAILLWAEKSNTWRILITSNWDARRLTVTKRKFNGTQ